MLFRSNHKCVGCWKVYGDEQAARNLFEKYEMCSKIYSRQWQQGKSIEQLTVGKTISEPRETGREKSC